MKSDTMTALTISGPIDRLGEAVRRFVVDHQFHPEDAPEMLSGVRRLRRVEPDDPYTPLLARADALLERAGVEPSYEAFGAYETGETDEYLASMEKRLDELETDTAPPERRTAADEQAVRLLKNVPETLRDLARLRYVHARLGMLGESEWRELSAMTQARTDQFAVEIGRENGEIVVLALALPKGLDDLDGNLSRLGFDRVNVTGDPDSPELTAAQVLAGEEEARREAEALRRENLARREELLEAEREELLRRRSWLAFEAACVRAESMAGRNTWRFYLAGWAPAEYAGQIDAACEAEQGFSCVLSTPREVKNAKPPVLIRDKGARSVLTPLMKMYGTPAYGTADPRLFMVVTYTLFFGMMFGDAGQGACIALLGWLLYRKTKAWLWRELSLCGLSAVVFGLIYGSVFGLEELLPWGGYHPLEAEHIMPVLLAGAAVGVAVILVCMAFNVVNCLRAGDLKGAYFSPNGVAGAVLYTAVLAGIVCAYTGAAKLFTGLYVVLFILAPIVLIWLGEPLAKLLEGRKDWQPESWGMYIVEGFFDIFESAISYMSNTMSFLRVGAFAISHAGMMMVVRMLSEGAAATGSVVIMVFGNIFVAGLEAALSSIQIIRLEFYEIFGRFYVGGGREFAPVIPQYTK